MASAFGLVLRHRLFEIGHFLARQHADGAQCGQMPLRIGEIADRKIGLADVLVRAAMARDHAKRAGLRFNLRRPLRATLDETRPRKR